MLAIMRKWSGWVALALLLAGLGLVIAAPSDFQQGAMVRILYLHVPSAKMALLMYVLLTVMSGLFLWKKSAWMDVVAEASVAVGAAFSVVTLATGSIWGKPMWGAWWAWDARLTSMLVLLILYVGLMALRHAMDDPQRAAKATAVVAIIGAVDLPIIHYSVTWWRTLHQPASFGGAGGTPAIVGDLLPPLLVMSVAFVALGIYMLAVKATLVVAHRRLYQLEMESVEA
jgi:heme exporter protein C